ncbi:hypothetical protein N8702_00640 [Verrucomicrobia bacterium]|nr:hypothetical protein [Verrucomicrobiota bacterium]MDA7660192.1 hypothetical protein [Verrucomicrobiota bacterium]
MKSRFVGSSWQEFLDLRNSLGDVGEWKGEGVTTGIWPGIPAGLKYEISQIIRWNADQTKLLHSYSLKAVTLGAHAIDGRIVMQAGLWGNVLRQSGEDVKILIESCRIFQP